MPVFLITIICAYFLVNAWIVFWFWRALRGHRKLQVAVCLTLGAVAFLYPLFFKNHSAHPLAHVLLYIGAVWTGGVIYMLLILLAGAVARAGYVVVTRQNRRPGRRAAAVVAALTALAVWASWLNAAFPVLYPSRLEVVTDDPALQGYSIRVGVLSDLHLGRLVRSTRMARMLDVLKPHQPDVIFFAGDVIDSHILPDLEAMRRVFATLEPPLGMWAINGNHEYISGNVEYSMDIMRSLGMNVLRDEAVVLDGRIIVAGRDDLSRTRFGGAPRATLPQVLETVPEAQRHLPLIVLDHQPWQLEQAGQAGAALQISGHTHNGQIWPFNFIVARLFENPHGLSVRGKTHYLVSAGAGTWGPPLRSTSRPEVHLIQLDFVAPGR